MHEALARFRKDIQAGRICLGASITFADPMVSDALGDAVDFLWIDLEHGSMSPEALRGHLVAARARQVPALVRVADSRTASIKPVLDAGADGIVVPQIYTPDEVRQAVNACRYPPMGTRGYGPHVAANYGREGGRPYMEKANATVLVAVQVETVAALQALDEIVTVPGLDAVVVGPADLSGAMGLPGQVEHPDVVAAIERVVRTAQAAGLSVGTGVGANPDYALRMIQRGVQWLHIGNDYTYLVQRMEQLTAAVRRSL